eukprot:5230989-Amphidinium_carterae.1
MLSQVSIQIGMLQLGEQRRIITCVIVLGSVQQSRAVDLERCAAKRATCCHIAASPEATRCTV